MSPPVSRSIHRPFPPLYTLKEEGPAFLFFLPAYHYCIPFGRKVSPNGWSWAKPVSVTLPSQSRGRLPLAFPCILDPPDLGGGELFGSADSTFFPFSSLAKITPFLLFPVVPPRLTLNGQTRDVLKLPAWKPTHSVPSFALRVLKSAGPDLCGLSDPCLLFKAYN